MQRFRLDRIPDNLLREPLEFLVADHVRQRKVCDALDGLVLGSERDRAEGISAAIFAYLSEDFLLHVSDEQIDFFPCLRAASYPASEVDEFIDALTRDHAVEVSLAWDIVVTLRRRMSPLEREANAANFSRLSSAFTECVRRHLAIEDSVLLPLARKRLSASDFNRMGHAMATRRDIDYPD